MERIDIVAAQPHHSESTCRSERVDSYAIRATNGCTSYDTYDGTMLAVHEFFVLRNSSLRVQQLLQS